MSAENESPTAAGPGPRAERGAATGQWHMVGVLTLIYTLNFVDRGVLNLIVNPIRQDLGLSDLQMSYLLGLSFITLYSLLSIPAGYLADIVSRRLLVGGAVLLWSAMETMCGLASSFWQLFAGRVGLGVGEAALPPAAFSLLRDGVAPGQRARALGIYGMGPILGNGVGALLGGALFAMASRGAFAGLPVLGGLKPWQIVIAVPGLIGLPLAFLLLTLREPARPAADRGDRPSYGEALAHVAAHRRLYLPLLAAVTLVSLATGWNSWLAAAIGRIWGLSPAAVGATLGPIGLIVTPVTYLTLGTLMDRRARRAGAAGPLEVAILGTALNVPPALAVLLMPSVPAMWGAVVLSTLLTGGVQVACGTVLTRITPSRLMGKVTALYFLLSNLLGLAPGPTVYALAAAWFFAGPRAIVAAMLLCYPLLMAATILALWFTVRALRRAGR